MFKQQYTVEEQKENRAKLVAALRSGEYEKGRGRMKDEEGRFCALGVACDITGIGDWRNYWRLYGHNAYVYRNPNTKRDYVDGYFVASVTEMPGLVQDFYGFRTNIGIYEDSNHKDSYPPSIQYLNDMRMVSFAEIADVIESEPPGMFVN